MAGCGGQPTKDSTGRRCPTPCRACRSAPWPWTRPTGRCGSAPARRIRRRTLTLAPAYTGRPMTARPSSEWAMTQPEITRWRPALCTGSPSTRTATHTRRPTTGCSATQPALTAGPRSWTPLARWTPRPMTSRSPMSPCSRARRARSSLPRLAGTGLETPRTTASISPLTAARPSPRSPRAAPSTPATSAAPPSPTPRTGPSSTRSFSRWPSWRLATSPCCRASSCPQDTRPPWPGRGR
jgi:hypothetical protein